MARKAYVGIENTSEKIKKIYVGVNGVAHKVKKIYVGVNNIARCCFSSIGGLKPIFQNNDWETIIAACEDGVVPDTWEIGDSKTINGDEWVIIGKNHDDLFTANTGYNKGSNKAALTLQKRHTYAEYKYYYNQTKSVEGGWRDSYLRNTHLLQVFTELPVEIQTAVKSVRKLSDNHGATISATEDKLFVPSETEVFGTARNSLANQGAQYDWYKSVDNRIKTREGTSDTTSWYLRSTVTASNDCYCFVSYRGETSYTYAGDTSTALAPCFCL